MIVTSKAKAWEAVNDIFPTDYEKDWSSSERAGYDIYRHASLNYYSRICDLGDRLEVLTGEFGENVVNIWIREPDQTVEEQTAATAQPIITRTVEEMTFAIGGYEWDRGHEKELYNKLGGDDAHWAASEFVVAWCRVNGGWGKKWGAVRITEISHYGKENHGHYCITALMSKCEGED